MRKRSSFGYALEVINIEVTKGTFDSVSLGVSAVPLSGIPLHTFQGAFPCSLYLNLAPPGEDSWCGLGISVAAVNFDSLL